MKQLPENPEIWVAPPGRDPHGWLANAALKAEARLVLEPNHADFTHWSRLACGGGLRPVLRLNGATEVRGGDWCDHLHAVVVPGDCDDAYRLAEPFRGGAEPAPLWVELTAITQLALVAAWPVPVAGLLVKGFEAAGLVGETTSFMLIQQVVQQWSGDFVVWGGIGCETAAAARVAGACGVVLREQLALARETEADSLLRPLLARLAQVSTRTSALPAQAERSQKYVRYLEQHAAPLQFPEGRGLDEAHVCGLRPDLLPAGVDLAWADTWSARYVTVSGMIAAVRDAMTAHPRAAQAQAVLSLGGGIAGGDEHRFPLVQGPMTRVSDKPEFARAVAEAGALPFMALAVKSGAQSADLLRATKEQLGDLPWGVGLLGFTPPALREAQLAAIHEHSPPFALIAGARPGQAPALEQRGIKTFVHVPSPALLSLFLKEGTRRFVFEGRECGGHVGPSSSFHLWQSMIAALLEQPRKVLAQTQVLFAGGIHDSLSAAMVATLAAPLVAAGVQIGLLCGSAYVFCREAVRLGAVVPQFQEVVRTGRHTVLLETAPGQASRCAISPYVAQFEAARQQARAENLDVREQMQRLEQLNLGRLRTATRGQVYQAGQDGAHWVAVDDETQYTQGMYMIGEVATLRTAVTDLSSLHAELTGEALRWLTGRVAPEPPRITTAAPADIAIIGMACIMPKADNVAGFWQNIYSNRDCITEVPHQRWSTQHYFDEKRSARDKVYSRWGGFIDPIPFDPRKFGIPPNSMASIDPNQLLALEIAAQTLDAAGYARRPFKRETTSVLFGASGTGDLGHHYILRTWLPQAFDKPPQEALAGVKLPLPEWTEDSFAGILANVITGRIANRFNLGGPNFTVDAACASSLAAVVLAVNQLRSGEADMALVGGVDTANNPFAYTAFSKTHALSPDGRIATLDRDANGIVISEGVAAVALKRLADAQRDGDAVYAVIKGAAGSSDGRAMGMTAPNREGQQRALRRAYGQAGFGPETVGLFELHGTGTAVGDRTELSALQSLIGDDREAAPRVALGSVKSQIGHTKCTAGVAGLIKAALALHQQVLPPTANVRVPNAMVAAEDNPFFACTRPLPWVAGPWPRRAGISSFGFGGTNFHVVLEEWRDASARPAPRFAQRAEAPVVFAWMAADRAAMQRCLALFQQKVSRLSLADCAADMLATPGQGPYRLAFVAKDKETLAVLTVRACAYLAGESQDQTDLFVGVVAEPAKIAMLFPGQGSQAPYMAAELAAAFPFIQEVLALFDRETAPFLTRPLSHAVYPTPAFDEAGRVAQRAHLQQTQWAQPALAAVNHALLTLLTRLGIQADMVAGHSFGELSALTAAGVIDAQGLALLAAQRGVAMAEAARGGMTALKASAAQTVSLVEAVCRETGCDSLWPANFNSPHQTVVCGDEAALCDLETLARALKIGVRRLPVAAAFHSPWLQSLNPAWTKAVAETPFHAVQRPVYSNVTAACYPIDDDDLMRGLLLRQSGEPVLFQQMVEQMAAAGATLFLEVGPGRVLSRLAADTLAGRNVTVLPVCTAAGTDDMAQVLATLWAAGHSPDLRQWTAAMLGESALLAKPKAADTGLSALTFWVDGRNARRTREVVVSEAKAAPAQTAQAPERQVSAASAANQTNATPQPGTDPSPDYKRSLKPSPFQVSDPSPAGYGVQTPRPKSDLSSIPSTPTKRSPSMSEQPSYAPGERQAVMQSYFQMMERVLQGQQTLMMQYLQGGSAPETVPAAPEPDRWQRFRASGSVFTNHQNETRATATPTPVDLPMPQMDVVGETPVVTTPLFATAAVEPLVAPARGPEPHRQPQAQATPARGPEPHRQPQAQATSVTATVWDESQLTEVLLEAVSERTGYPPDMLDFQLDLEGDLGIDSIKRIEIFAGLFERLAIPIDSLQQQDMDHLSGLRTLEEIRAWILNRLGENQGGGDVPTKKAAASSVR